VFVTLPSGQSGRRTYGPTWGSALISTTSSVAVCWSIFIWFSLHHFHRKKRSFRLSAEIWTRSLDDATIFDKINENFEQFFKNPTGKCVHTTSTIYGEHIGLLRVLPGSCSYWIVYRCAPVHSIHSYVCCDLYHFFQMTMATPKIRISAQLAPKRGRWQQWRHYFCVTLTYIFPNEQQH